MFNTCGHELVNKATMNEVNSSTKCVTFCHNCYTTLKTKKKIPRMSVSNGLELDEIPYELKIPTDLEQQLFATSLIFMKVIQLPKNRMKGQKDKLINVPLQPSDVSKTLNILPRCVDDAAIVPLQLKRKQEYKHAHADGFIRPTVCVKAVVKLKELDNPHYKDVVINYDKLFEPPPAKKMKIDDENSKEAAISDSDDDSLPQAKKIIIDDVNFEEEDVASDSDDDSHPQPKKPKIDDGNLEEEDVGSDSDDDNLSEVPILNTVKEFQADQTENTCLIREDLEARIVENRTDSVIQKKKGKNNTISVQPGEGKVMILLLNLFKL